MPLLLYNSSDFYNLKELSNQTIVRMKQIESLF